MDSKKISFGFSKLKKASQLVKPVEVEKTEVQYVDEFNGEEGKFSYQGTVRVDPNEKKTLVIPCIGTRTAYDVIKSKLDKKDEIGDNIKVEPVDDSETQPGEAPPPDKQPDVKPTLEQLAAKEILQSLSKGNAEEEGGDDGRVIAPDIDQIKFEGEAESTLEDYENVPVGDYGMALLRGMGWTPNTGIGKDSKVVAPVASKLRPKRLGLGAEGAPPPGEGLTLKKGSYIQVVMGQMKNSVGVVDSLDGDSGCVFARIQGRGNVTLSENVLKIITPKQYDELVRNPGTKNGVDKPESKQYGIVAKVKSERDEPRKVEPENKLNQAWQQRIREKKENPQKNKKRKAARRSRSEESEDRSRARRQREESPDRVKDRSIKQERDSESPARAKERSRKHKQGSRSPTRIKERSRKREHSESPSRRTERSKKREKESSESPVRVKHRRSRSPDKKERSPAMTKRQRSRSNSRGGKSKRDRSASPDRRKRSRSRSSKKQRRVRDQSESTSSSESEAEERRSKKDKKKEHKRSRSQEKSKKSSGSSKSRRGRDQSESASSTESEPERRVKDKKKNKNRSRSSSVEEKKPKRSQEKSKKSSRRSSSVEERSKKKKKSDKKKDSSDSDEDDRRRRR